MNIGKMMNQVNQFKKQIKHDQQQINQRKFVGKSPDNLVQAVLTGDHQLQDLKVNPKVIDPKDPDMMTDLIISAVNAAEKQIAKVNQDTLGKYTHNIPGM